MIGIDPWRTPGDLTFHAHHFDAQSFSARRPARLRAAPHIQHAPHRQRIAAQRPNDEAGVPQISMDASQVPVRACGQRIRDSSRSSSSDSRQRFIASLTEYSLSFRDSAPMDSRSVKMDEGRPHAASR